MYISADNNCKLHDYRFRHPYLLMLMCYATEPPALVYPLMKNMSLHSNLHNYDVRAIRIQLHTGDIYVL